MPKRTKAPRPSTAAARPKNRLLASLPEADLERLRPHLRTLPTRARQIFHPLNDEVHEVVFLNGGVASVTTVMRDGRMVEIATIGDEGLVGMDVFFGGKIARGETMLQVPDTNAEFMSARAFRAELARGGAFLDAIQRYSQGLVTLIMHSTACMALHPVQERCCRWLLMTHDRVRKDDFQLSHEFLAVMLGATRPTISVVAATLQKAGLISYTHGHITIVDRKALEAASCECYHTVKSRFDELGL